MQHGSHLLRYRRAARWALGILLLAGLAAGVEAFFPPRPRWVMPVPSLGYVAIAPDGKTVVTAPGDDKDVRVGAPILVRDLNTGAELGSFFAGAYQLDVHGFLPARAELLLVNVQQRQGGPWQFHLVDTVKLTTRPLQFDRTHKQFHVQFAADRPLALATPSADDAPRLLADQLAGKNDAKEKFQVSLIDLAEDRVLQQWRLEYLDHTHFLGGNRLFIADTIGAKWHGIFWDIARQEPLGKTGPADYVKVVCQNRFILTREAICIGHMRMKLWDAASLELRADFVASEGSVTLSDDGAWAIIDGYDVDAAILWNVRGAAPLGEFAPGVFEFHVVAGEPCILSCNIDGTVLSVGLRDLATQTRRWERSWSEPNASVWHGGSASYPLPRDYVIFGTRIEFLDLATGDTRKQLPLAGPQLQTKVQTTVGNVRYLPFLSDDKRFLTIAAQYRDKEPSVFKRWLERLKLDKVIWRDGQDEHRWVFIIDLQSETICFQSIDYASASLQHLDVSPDSKSVVIGTSTAAGYRLECWDVPAPRPWPWILGIPMVLGFCTWLMCRGWIRWRRRAA